MYDLALYLLLGVVQIAFAVWGGVVSAKSLPVGESKARHLWGFGALGVTGLALTIAVGLSNYSSQQKTAKIQDRTDGELAQSRLAEEYMKGQLAAMSVMIRQPSPVAAIPVNQGSGTKETVGTAELKTAALDLSKRMKRFEKSYLDLAERLHENASGMVQSFRPGEQEKLDEANRAREAEITQLNTRESADFRAIFLDQANFIRIEMTRRINQPLRFSESREPVAFTGELQGPHPISDAADYLQLLAKALPK